MCAGAQEGAGERRGSEAGEWRGREENRGLMGLAVLELFLALVAVLEVHEVQLDLVAGELRLVVLDVDSVVELAHPDGQRLARLHRHGPELGVSKVALQMPAAQLARKELAQRSHEHAHARFVLLCGELRVGGGEGVEVKPRVAPQLLSPRQLRVAVGILAAVDERLAVIHCSPARAGLSARGRGGSTSGGARPATLRARRWVVGRAQLRLLPHGVGVLHLLLGEIDDRLGPRQAAHVLDLLALIKGGDPRVARDPKLLGNVPVHARVDTAEAHLVRLSRHLRHTMPSHRESPRVRTRFARTAARWWTCCYGS